LAGGRHPERYAAGARGRSLPSLPLFQTVRLFHSFFCPFADDFLYYIVPAVKMGHCFKKSAIFGQFRVVIQG
jgi:hypothetical protein